MTTAEGWTVTDDGRLAYQARDAATVGDPWCEDLILACDPRHVHGQAYISTDAHAALCRLVEAAASHALDTQANRG